MNPDLLLQKLTIAIPVYNDEKYIHETVESCIGQAQSIVIYDNASTDQTSHICAELMAQHPSVKHVRHAENVGAFENFKRSLFACTTEYFSWIGSHDVIDKNYSLPVIAAMEQRPHSVLGAGTIVYIDEEGQKTGHIVKTDWAEKTHDQPAVERVGLCATEMKDCFLFYGILRTKNAQAAWFDQPSLGFDRAFVCKMAAQGEFIFTPQSTFFARSFDKARKDTDTNERRSKVIGKSTAAPISKDLFLRDKSMVETVLQSATSGQDLKRAVYYINKINRRYMSRRKVQKIRIILAAALAISIITMFLFI